MASLASDTAAEHDGPSATPGSHFTLDGDTEAQLLAMYADSPERLERVKRKLARARDNARRIEELLRRRQLLQQRNRLLAEPTTAAPTNPATPSPSGSLAATLNHANSSGANSPGPTPSYGGPSGSSNLIDPAPSSSVGRSTTSSAVGSDWAGAQGRYVYCGPRGVTGMVSPVFPHGELFRIVTEAKEWAFYNDTRNYEMHVCYLLHERSEVAAPEKPRAGEHARVTASRRLTKRAGGQWEACVVVPPEETAILFTGVVSGFEDRCKAVLLTFGAEADDSTDRGLCAEAWEAWDAIVEAAGAAGRAKAGAVFQSPPTSPPGRATLSPAAVAAAEEVLGLCMRHKLPFVDPSFFPCYGRLFRSGVDAFALPLLHWRPPRAYLPPAAQGEEALFLGQPKASSVAGGPLLPDQNVLSVIAALTQLASPPPHEEGGEADRPRALSCLFTHPEVATAPPELKSGGAQRQKDARFVRDMEQMLGAYRVQLCLSGWWRSVLVDAHVPAAQHRPEFARCRDDLRALWLPLLEKAYAKSYGSYSAMLEATVPDVVANLTGSLCHPLGSAWPAEASHSKADAAASDSGAEEARRTAFVKLVRRLVHPTRGGRLLLRTFPLSLAKSKGRRDRLEDIYRALGLVPGSTVMVLGVDELSTGDTIVRLRQNARDAKATGGDGGDSMAFWRRLGKRWVDSLWELELTHSTHGTAGSQAASHSPEEENEDTLWMDLADVPQYFQEGFCFYPAPVEWGGGGEVRAKGSFTGRDGVPSVCVKLEVTGPTTVIACVTQPERRFLHDTHHTKEDPHPRKGAGGDDTATDMQQHAEAGAKRMSTSASLSTMAGGGGAGEVRGLALQVIHKGKAGHELLANSTSPDIFSVGEQLQFSFHRDAGIGLELTPEHGPYYVVPRVSPPTAFPSGSIASDIPYVLSITAKDAIIGLSPSPKPNSPKLHVSFVELAATAKVFRHSKTSAGTAPEAPLRPAVDVKETAAEYQLCRVVGDQRLLVHNKRIDVV